MSFEIKENTTYRINTESDYFLNKYGEQNPEIQIEAEASKVFGKPWTEMVGNPAAMLFAVRTLGDDNIPLGGKVYYGKVGYLGEVVHESELVELN